MSKNKLSGTVSDFTSAADQLRLEMNNSISPQKKHAPRSIPPKINGSYAPKNIVRSPEKRYAPETTSYGSPAKKKAFAPQYKSTNNVPNRQVFHSATGNNVPFLRREDRSITNLSPRSSTRSLRGASPGRTSYISDDVSPTRPLKKKTLNNIHVPTAGTFRIEAQSNSDTQERSKYFSHSLTSSECSNLSSMSGNSGQSNNLIQNIKDELDLSDDELLNDISIERRRDLLTSGTTKKAKSRFRNRQSKVEGVSGSEDVIDLKSEFEEDDSLSLIHI